MKKYTVWKKSDIESLSTAYISGMRIKTIAHLMNRTPSSVNRALDRLKIRQSKHPSLHEGPPTPRPRIQAKRQYHKESCPKPFQDLEVSINVILSWAQRHYNHCLIHDEEKGLYLINGVPKSPGQLVLECNRYRLTQNLPVYYVHGVCL